MFFFIFNIISATVAVLALIGFSIYFYVTRYTEDKGRHGGACIEERMIFAVMNKKWN